MPCNLAVSITKAAIPNEQLLGLLTPAVVEQVVRAFLGDRLTDLVGQDYGYQHGTSRKVQLQSVNYWGQLGAEGISFRIHDGQIDVQAPRGGELRAQEVSDELTQLLARTADQLFAIQVGTALAELGGDLETQQVSIDNAGQRQTVTQFTLSI